MLEVTGKPSLQMVAHCYGAMSFAMAMLGGLKGVRAAAISQIAAHADVPWFPQRILAYLRAPDLMRLVGAGLLDARATKKRNLLAARSTPSCASLTHSAAPPPSITEPHHRSTSARIGLQLNEG